MSEHGVVECVVYRSLSGLRGHVQVPGDKSLTHRAVLFGSIALGTSQVRTKCLGRDNFASIRVMQQLGVNIKGDFPKNLYKLAIDERIENAVCVDGDEALIVIAGRGFNGLSAPNANLSDGVLYCGNSGTTARLLCGILASRNFRVCLTGDHSLSKRPFKRISEPLSKMGACFDGDMLPFQIQGGDLCAIDYFSPKSSAQVKSAIILAGLRASGMVSVIEPTQSRDHTERMLSAMGVEFSQGNDEQGRWRVSISQKPENLSPISVDIPGDFSAAAFFICAGVMFPGSNIVISNVGVNATRTGLLDLLWRMGADISVVNERVMGGEPVADIVVKSSTLHGIDVTACDVVRAIDEIPIFGVVAAVASGVTTIRGAEELRVKESDRLSMIAAFLSSVGCEVQELPDGLVINGMGQTMFNKLNDIRPDITQNHSASWRTSGDHRISMSAAVLELFCYGSANVRDIEAIETSYPDFCAQLQMLCGG